MRIIQLVGTYFLASPRFIFGGGTEDSRKVRLWGSATASLHDLALIEQLEAIRAEGQLKRVWREKNGTKDDSRYPRLCIIFTWGLHRHAVNKCYVQDLVLGDRKFWRNASGKILDLDCP